MFPTKMARRCMICGRSTIIRRRWKSAHRQVIPRFGWHGHEQDRGRSSPLNSMKNGTRRRWKYWRSGPVKIRRCTTGNAHDLVKHCRGQFWFVSRMLINWYNSTSSTWIQTKAGGLFNSHTMWPTDKASRGYLNYVKNMPYRPPLTGRAGLGLWLVIRTKFTLELGFSHGSVIGDQWSVIGGRDLVDRGET